MATDETTENNLRQQLEEQRLISLKKINLNKFPKISCLITLYWQILTCIRFMWLKTMYKSE